MSYDDKIDFRKIFEEDENFRQFMLRVNEAMLLNDPNFQAGAQFMYAMYQSGIDADTVIKTMHNMQKMRRASE